MFQKLWTSPVWSKVIATGIITTIGFFIALGYSFTTEMNPKEAIQYIWNYETKIGYSFLALILLFTVQILLNTGNSKSTSKLSKKQKIEKDFCDNRYKTIDPDNEIVFRFNTYISSYTKQPFITDLTPFCTKHNGQEKKMRWFGGCPDKNCSNYNKNGSERELKDQIESNIIVEWEKFNGKY